MTKQLEFRGIPRSLIISYLLTITNGQSSDIITNQNNSVTIKKKEITVTISKEQTLTISSITIPSVFIFMEGEEEIINKTIQQLRTRTVRLGG